MPTGSRRAPKLTRSRTRLVVQVLATLFILSMVLARYAPESGFQVPARWPDLHGLCPIAMVETMGGVLQGDGFAATERSNLWMLLGALATALVAGALFCGWFCPLGAVQDWIGRLGRRLPGRRHSRLVPPAVDRSLSWMRFAVLALVLVQTVRFIGFVPSWYNPSRALFHIWFGGAFPAGTVLLALIVIGSLLVERPWCRWLCPFGAVQGAASLISPITIRRRTDRCTSCKRCSRLCPMGVNVHASQAVRDSRCTRCSACLDACPIPGALGFPWRNAAMTGIVAVALLFLPVAIARATGAYQPFAAVAEATLTPEEIGPTMSLAQVAAGLGLTGDELLRALDMDASFDLETRIFDIEEDERYEHINVAYVRRALTESE